MKNKKTLKSIPRFKTKNQERQFWATHDVTDYFDTDKSIKLDLSQLKPSTKTITIRVPESMLHALKQKANQQDVPYQSLLKIILHRQLKQDQLTSSRY